MTAVERCEATGGQRAEITTSGMFYAVCWYKTPRAGFSPSGRIEISHAVPGPRGEYVARCDVVRVKDLRRVRNLY